MSRGLGKTQRAVLAVFDANPDVLLDSIEVTGLIHAQFEVSESQASSVRRALRKLVAAGRLVDMGRGFRFGRRRYALPDTAERYRVRVQRTFGTVAPPVRPLEVTE